MILCWRQDRSTRSLLRKKPKDDDRLEHHPEFLQRVAEARAAFRAGRGTRLDDLPS